MPAFTRDSILTIKTNESMKDEKSTLRSPFLSVPRTPGRSRSGRASLQNSPLIGISPCRRRSSTSRYDFNDDFLKLVATSCNLRLFPEEILGRGSFGTVLQGLYQDEPVAVKVMKTSLRGHLTHSKGEKNAIYLVHPHVVKVLDIFQLGPEKMIIVMELMQKGNLFQLLNDPEVIMQFTSKLRVSGQIASALSYCHQEGILHLDVKPQNILLDLNGNCKLSDFGTSKRVADIMQPFSDQYTLEGTVAYKAPELFRGQPPTTKCDVYSFGICMWQILYRGEPYKGLPDHAIIYQVVAKGLRPNHSFIVGDIAVKHTEKPILSTFVNLYESCWLPEPLPRPEMQSITDKLLLLLYHV